MGIYYSEDRRNCTSTLDYLPRTYLTSKGIKDRDAAIIIQRWWKRVKPQIYSDSDSESYTTDVDAKTPISTNVNYLVGITGITIGIVMYLLH